MIELLIKIVGLDNSGKTTALYFLKLGEVISTTPTIGFNVETVVYKNVSFTVWDIGGQDKIVCFLIWQLFILNNLFFREVYGVIITPIAQVFLILTYF